MSQAELFPGAGEPVKGTATYSPCGRYRYTLTRKWDPSRESLVVIGLNPSTATETEDDPTIRKLIGYARRESFGGLMMLNLFAWRATDPKAMLAEVEPVGPENDAAIDRETRGATTVLVAWGTHGTHRGRGPAVLERLLAAGPRLMAEVPTWQMARNPTTIVRFGVTKNGQPLHPLYLRALAPLERVR